VSESVSWLGMHSPVLKLWLFWKEVLVFSARDFAMNSGYEIWTCQ